LLDAVSRPIALVVAGLSVVGFLVGLGTSGLMVAFAVIGLLYFLMIPVSLIYFELNDDTERSIQYRIREYLFIAFFVGLWVAALVKALQADDTHFGLFPFFGMIATAAVVMVLSYAFVLLYRRSHQTCPECMNVIHAEARICHYCGFRFRPRVPAALD
jgi:hypothetical protein